MIKRIMTKFLNRNFIIFAFIGLFNTVLALLLYSIFVTIGMEVGISSIIGDCIPMIFSYFLNMRFTYNKKPNLKSFVTFPISYLPGIVINMLVTLIFVNTFGAPKLFAKALALPITIPLNFLTMSMIVKFTTRD